jgi:hypothetical protein
LLLPVLLARWQQRRDAAFSQRPPPLSHFWQLPGEDLSRGDKFAAWFAATVQAAGVSARPGRRLHPHCVRRGGASAARALGAPLERVCQWGGWALGGNAVYAYIDVSVVPCPSAAAFFGHLLPPGLAAAAVL